MNHKNLVKSSSFTLCQLLLHLQLRRFSSLGRFSIDSYSTFSSFFLHKLFASNLYPCNETRIYLEYIQNFICQPRVLFLILFIVFFKSCELERNVMKGLGLRFLSSKNNSIRKLDKTGYNWSKFPLISNNLFSLSPLLPVSFTCTA